MFEKEAEEYNQKVPFNPLNVEKEIRRAFQKGAEFGYNKANEEVKHDLMIKLKDEGIVKPLKDSILRNQRLNSQEQQELCAWIECAMDFGENLDECAKELEEAKNANEWHYVKDGNPNNENDILCQISKDEVVVGYFHQKNKQYYTTSGEWLERVIAWKEIVPSKEIKEND